jgi:hypothetical protein
MRYATLLLLVPALLATGCSMFIAGAGKNATSFETRDEVHRQLGEPLSSTTENGLVIEEFRSRRKYAEPIRANQIMWGWIVTWGTAELIAFPREVGRFVTRRFIGHSLKYTFNADGTIANATIDGTPAAFHFPNREPLAAPRPEPPTPEPPVK